MKEQLTLWYYIMTSNYTVSCGHCGLAELCIPHTLTRQEIERVDSIIKRHKPLHKGDDLYREGDSFSCLYAVRSGSFKVYTMEEDGSEQVIAFYLPGEILGMDAIDRKVHISNAKSMETSAVCEIPYDEVEHLSGKIHNLQVHLYRLLSREIRIDHELQLLLAKKTAEERLGVFLMNLSARYARRHLSPTHFRLPMSRADISAYLGLAVETVSRILTRMQAQGVLKVKGRDVEILDTHALCALAHSKPDQLI